VIGGALFRIIGLSAFSLAGRVICALVGALFFFGC